MSGKVQAAYLATLTDAAGYASQFITNDKASTGHDIVDTAPIVLGTSGQLGSMFVNVPTPVAQIERLALDTGPSAGTDIILRVNGGPAVTTGSLTDFNSSIDPGDTLVLDIDGAGNKTITFDGSETTFALAAARVNHTYGYPFASTLTAGNFVLTGVKTGGFAASLLAWSYGYVRVVSGAAAAKLGLAIGFIYGTGADLRLGAGLSVLSFSANSLPRKLELSGTDASIRFVLAGKA